MLHDFVTANRAELIARARSMVKTRAAPRPSAEELEHGVPLFLDQLVATLRRASGNGSGLVAGATEHAGYLQKMGFTIAQVVHDYGDVCLAVKELASERHASITVDEFRTLNRCVDDAIAGSVTEFMHQRVQSPSDDETDRLGSLALELRNRVGAAMIAYATIRSGRVGPGGSTGAGLEHNLRGIRDVIDRSLAQARIEAGTQHRDRIPLIDFLEELELNASLEAREHGGELIVGPVEQGVEMVGDRAVLAAAMNNVLQNAFQFSCEDARVSLTTTVTKDRILFEVADECGGLPADKGEAFFLAADPTRANGNGTGTGTGTGLGLFVSRKGIDLNGGEMHVRDVPGTGCVFSISLPRHLDA